MHPDQTVHQVLAKSYLAYFLASLIGLFIDSFLTVSFDAGFVLPLAIVLLGVGPLLIFWAQYISWKFRSDGSAGTHYFHHGPYRIVRNPTHLGLLLLVTGYTLVSGSVVFFGTTLVGFLISNVFFKKYEVISHDTYGDNYKTYKEQTPKL